ncbi:hypothetical protein LCL99_05760 [Halomonas denitrificans]|uniref:Gfo/Idh/MocA family protein n=1 Tax=Halomonas denitrificans TaxID=370769 RepID=UPI001CD571B2|nr:hypothetical protein [Halomonas denitrificans]MCA0973967.1 hypothetical protein [Halomonas denitrificans]
MNREWPLSGRRPRVAVVNPAHWHFPMYRPGIEATGAEFVGFYEDQRELVSPLESSLAAPCYGSIDDLCESARPDFVFAFGEHARLPTLAGQLIDHHMPFSLEKPGGVDRISVTTLRQRAESSELFVSVPFHYRLSDMAATLDALAPGDHAGIRSMRFDVQARTPLQHSASSPWLVDPERAGGGAAMNLGHHPIDFVLSRMGHELESVEARMSSDCLGLAVEDDACIRLDFSHGRHCDVRVGYNQPVDNAAYMGFAFELEHESFLARLSGDRLWVEDDRGARAFHLPAQWTFKRHFADYARTTLARYLCQAPPVASLADLERTMWVLEAAYLSAQRGQRHDVTSFPMLHVSSLT